MGPPGKPDGIDGSEVEKYVREGHIAEVAAYCETDVVLRSLTDLTAAGL
jgi:hypothetical protein